MNTPNGTTIVFEGGSFTGVLPSKVELAGSPRISANGVDADVRASSDFTLPSGASLTLSGGSFSHSGATIAGTLDLTNVDFSSDEGSRIVVSGALTFSGANSPLALEELTRSSGGSIDIQDCASASGDEWDVDALYSEGDVVITTLECDSTLHGARCEGDDWTVGALECSSASVGSLTTSGYDDGNYPSPAGNATIEGNADGNDWEIAGALRVEGTALIEYLTTDGAVVLGGNAGGESWSVGGIVDISEDGIAFEVPTLALNGEASISLENVESLSLGEEGVLILNESLELSGLSTSQGSNIMLADYSILAATTTASFLGATTLSGNGYLAVPAGASTSNLNQADGADVRVCRYGAGITALRATCRDGETITATVAKASAVPILAEVKIDDAWELINAEVSSATFTTSVQGQTTEIRAFDGENFVYASVYRTPSHTWLTYAKSVAVQTDVSWKITTEWMMASEYCRAGEAVVLRARIEKSETSEPLTSEAVDSISYTCYKKKTVWGSETKTPVQGHENVAIPVNTVFDELIDDDPRWTKDETGYNWKFEPDTTTYPIFPTPGNYTILVTIKMIEGNPAPIYFEIEAN